MKKDSKRYPENSELVIKYIEKKADFIINKLEKISNQYQFNKPISSLIKSYIKVCDYNFQMREYNHKLKEAREEAKKSLLMKNDLNLKSLLFANKKKSILIKPVLRDELEEQKLEKEKQLKSLVVGRFNIQRYLNGTQKICHNKVKGVETFVFKDKVEGSSLKQENPYLMLREDDYHPGSFAKAKKSGCNEFQNLYLNGGKFNVHTCGNFEDDENNKNYGNINHNTKNPSFIFKVNRKSIFNSEIKKNFTDKALPRLSEKKQQPQKNMFTPKMKKMGHSNEKFDREQPSTIERDSSKFNPKFSKTIYLSTNSNVSKMTFKCHKQKFLSRPHSINSVKIENFLTKTDLYY